MRGLTPAEVVVLEDALSGAPPYLARGHLESAVHALREAGRVSLVETPNSFGPTARKVVVTPMGRDALMIHRFLRVGL